MSDAINPAHYKRLPAEAIEIIESAIDGAPSNQDAYLHGQVLKYVLRCWNKSGIEDLKKAKWYLDRLINSLDEYEQQKAADLQSLKDHPFGKLKELAWAPKVGDWVRINAPEPGDPMHTKNLEDLDGHILQVVGQSEFDERYAAFKSDHGSFYVLIDLLEPAEQPEATVEVAVEVTGEVTGEVKPPDGWRWIEVGEVIRKGDQGFENGLLYAIEPMKIGMTLQAHWMPTIRRNRFEVGEKVVDFCGQVWEVEYIFDTGNRYRLKNKDVRDERYGNSLAPYIEDAT